MGVNSEGRKGKVEFTSPLFCHLPLSCQNRGEVEKTPFVSTHYMSAVIVPNESPVCGSFQQKMVTDLANWTWLESP